MKLEIRNSLPKSLAILQSWMESERLLCQLLSIPTGSPVSVLHIRRNFKFRKLIVKAGDERFICYTHHWPRGLRNMAEFSQLAAQAGVTVPQPMQVAIHWSALFSQRCFSLVLPYIHGSTLGGSATTDQLERLGAALGKLHSIRGSDWGPLMSNFPARGNYWAGLQRYWRKTQKQLEQHATFADTQNTHEVMHWLLKHGAFLSEIVELSLIHGDPASGNFLVQPEGELCLIDCDRIGFEPGPMELANTLLQSFCAGDSSRRMMIIQAYLNHCPTDVRQLWEDHAQFFIAAALLWRGQRKLQWSIKRHTTGHSSERAILAWQQLLKVIKAKPADWQESVELLS